MGCLISDADGNVVGKLRYVIARMWNQREIPHTEGAHDIPVQNCAFLEFEGERLKCKIAIRAVVTVERRFGPWPVSKLKGFADLQSGGLLTKEFTTDSLSPVEIETGKVAGWVVLTPDHSPIKKPVITLPYSDHQPESEQEEQQEGRTTGDR